MFNIIKLSQFRYIGRIITEIDAQTYDCFATYHDDDIVIKLRRLCYRFKLKERLAFEMMTQIGTYKLCLRFECIRANNWYDICDIKIFGLLKVHDTWSSIIVSPMFANHLEISGKLLKTMFNRIQTFEHTDIKYSHTVKGTFLAKIQQPCNDCILALLLNCWRRRQMVCKFRNKCTLKRVWYMWLEHFYAPDTKNGFLRNHTVCWNRM